MSEPITIAVISALPPTIAAALAFLGTRSLRRSVGPTNGVPLSRIVEGLEVKVDRLVDSQINLGEPIARVEGQLAVGRRAFKASRKTGGRTG